jgi:hypothetical protein
MRFSKSHIVYDVVYDIVCQPTISYTIYHCIATYDIVGHIVGQDTVLGNRTYDIVGHIVYDIVCQTYDIVYDFVFSYDIIGGRTVLANRRLRRRIR